jgi:hypothetical protein|tara:strand:- start:577 stop:1050 length:474 start_codon:yes stop_codon:yes gene_type:complete
MERLLILAMLATPTATQHHEILHSAPVTLSSTEQVYIAPTLRDLIDALIYVESGGIENAIGDRHFKKPSVGVLQLRPIMVREVNRILKRRNSTNRYTLQDRFSKSKSIEMFLIWKGFHHEGSSFEKIARGWNGGPRGHKKKSTLKYWRKVQKQLKKI